MNQDNPVLMLERHPVPLNINVKYLGVMLDSALSFRRYIAEASHRSAKAAIAVNQLMPDVGEPSEAKREILMAVAISRMLYAALVWAIQASANRCNREKVQSAQRTSVPRKIRTN